MRGVVMAAGLDGNPPVRSLIKLARGLGALNQTGFSHHWLDRYTSSIAVTNWVICILSCRQFVGPIGFLPCQHDPCDPGQLVGECDGDEPKGLLLHELPDPIGHGR